MAHKGRFWRTDTEGFLVNDAHRDYIGADFAPLIASTIQAITANIHNDVHSIYVVGSVARGLARIGISDIDFVVVLERKVDAELVMRDWEQPTREALTQQYAHLVSKVDIDIVPDGYIFRDPEEFSMGAFLLASQSVCLWGSDLVPELPRYHLRDEKIRAGIANDDIVNLMPDIDEALDAIEADASDTHVADWCKRICKNMLRAGFSLTMLPSGLYTRDVDLCYEQFAQFYPANADAQKQALGYVAQPTCSANDLHDYLTTHGEWLVETCEAWLDQHNPERYDAFVYGDDPDFEPYL